MKTPVTLLCTMMLIIGTAFGQNISGPKVRLFKNRLPKGVSEARASQLVQLAAIARSADSTADETFARKFTSFAQAMNQQASQILPYIEQENWSKEFNAGFKRIGESAVPWLRKVPQLEQLYRKYRTQMDAAVRKSGIVSDALKQMASSIFGGERMKLILPDLREEILGSLPPITPSGPAPGTTDTFTIRAPFPVEEAQQEKKGACIGQSAVGTSDGETGAMSADVETGCFGAGSRPKATGTVGAFIDVPSGVKQVELTATLNVTNYFVYGFTEFGYITATTTGEMTVTGNFFNPVGGGIGQPNNLNLRSVKEILARITTAVPWVEKTERGNKLVQLHLKFDVPQQDQSQQYLIRINAKASIFSEGFALGDAATTAQCTGVFVRFIR